MAAHFRIEHTFRCPDVALYWRGYFDPAHIAEQDAAVEIARRETLIEEDRGDHVYREVHCIPRRLLSGFVRRLGVKEIGYTEKSSYWPADDRIDMEIVPSVFTDRVDIRATFTVRATDEGMVQRVYEGDIAVDIPVVGRRIERSAIRDMHRSFDIAARTTQAWLDAQPPQ